MSFSQNIKFSNLTLIAGVFFALFMLSACVGNSDEAVPFSCGVDEDLVADGTCVPFLTEAECVAVGFKGVDDKGNCIPLTASECVDAGLNISANGVCIGNSYTQCISQKYNGVASDGKCISFTKDECISARYKGEDDGKCVVYTTQKECRDNNYQDMAPDSIGRCAAYTQATCQTDGKFWDSGESTCVAKLTVSDCVGYNGVDANTNTCLAYTNQAECGSLKFDTGKCVAFTDATTCSTILGGAAQYKAELNNGACVAYLSTETGFYTSPEYNKSGALAGVKAAEAYANIATLIATDAALATPTNMIKQGGEGQIVSIVSGSNFNVKHQEFDNGDGSVAFDSVYIAEIDKRHTANDTLLTAATFGPGKAVPNSAGGGNCAHLNICYATQYAAIIAGRKDGTGMHGIAYNAQLHGITADRFEANLIKAVPKGIGADIIAMNHVWFDSYDIKAVNGKYYDEPKRAALSSAELTIWRDAVSTTDSDSATADNQTPNNTIMVFMSGTLGWNSETGRVYNWTNFDDTYNPTDLASSVADANRTDWHAAYPVLYDESAGKDQIKGNADDADGIDGIAGNDDDIDEDFTSDRWLVVVGLDTNDKILPASNGCGVAMNFCLAAPSQNLYAANNNGHLTDGYQTIPTNTPNYGSSIVAGALAVLKGAFPQATPEQLTRLVLETSDYIPLDNKNPDGTAFATEEMDNRVQATKPDGTAIIGRYVNPVYGWGKLNLETATHMDVDISSLSVGNNESIGVLWKDTQLTLSSHFGGRLDSISLGIGDEYGRHFTVKANKITSAPVAVASLDEYMGNILADNVQSEKLGGQAKLNYSNNAQPWMNLQYTSGKATSKIAFQDNYKISPLNDNATTSILRANHIRPASHNIGMMDVDYALNGNLSLSSYAARGEYDTGYKFDELGTDFDVNYKKSHLNIAIGNIREHDQFLGTHTTGGYALNAPTVSRFTDVTYGHDLGKTDRFNIYANYINYETDVDMLYDQFASIDGLQADQYQVGFTGKSLISDDDSLNVALITKLGVTDGALNQNTTLGYTADGGFNDVSQSYDLAVNERHQQFEITYQGKIYQNSQDGVSVLKDNRFFTTIRVDQNLNHVQGASQTEIVSGVSARF